jgi:hypothetical protein
MARYPLAFLPENAASLVPAPQTMDDYHLIRNDRRIPASVPRETGLKKPCRWPSAVFSWLTPTTPLKRADRSFSGSTKRRADGWQVSNAAANAWHNESEITKDGLNSKLLFDLTPTIDRVDRLEPTLATMAAGQSQAQEKLARWERTIRPRAAGPGCVVLILASVSFTALLSMTIAFGPSSLA